MLKVRWSTSEEDCKAIVAANRAGIPVVPGVCDKSWINGTIKRGEDGQAVVEEQRAQEAAWKAWDNLPWADRGRAEQPPKPRRKLDCTEAPEDGMRFCAKHGHDWAEPNLKRQAKAKEALRKLTKGMKRTVLEDGTEVYE